MSTIKITQLPALPSIASNTANSILLGVDIPTGTTGKFTVLQLAQQMYSNNSLAVGNNLITLPNAIAQFSGNVSSYMQVNIQNFNNKGTSDLVLTADTGTDSSGYVDFGLNNSQWDPVAAAQTSQYPYDGYVVTQGTTNGVGNLVIGTSTTNTSVVFAVGGYMANNVVARVTPTGLTVNGSISSGNIIPITSNRDLGTPNQRWGTLWLSANSIHMLDAQTGNDAVFTISNSVMQVNNTAAFAVGSVQITANGTIYSPNLIVSGNLYANSVNTVVYATNMLMNTSSANNIGSLRINNSSFSANSALVRIDASTGYGAQPVIADGYMLQIQGKDGVPTRVIFDGSGTNAYPLLAGRFARGTAASPTQPQVGDVLFRVAASGYGTSGYSLGGSSRIDFVSKDNFTDTTKGTEIQFWATPAGSNTITQIANLTSNTATFTGVVNPQKGFIWTPSIYQTPQTAITVDFSSNSVIRVTSSSGLTISFTNYVIGKEVQVWFTNTAAGNQTLTHGVSATNSTVNSTTYTTPGTSTVLIKYWCMDGTLANTFCAIIHS